MGTKIPTTSYTAVNLPTKNHCTTAAQSNNFNRKAKIKFNLTEGETSFTGRTVELAAIEESLDTNKIVIICGLGGIGKTELTGQFAWKYKIKHDANIVWINAEFTNIILEQIKKVAIALKINCVEKDFQQIIKDIYNELNKRKALIIFDNVLNKNDINSFLLHENYKNVKILITSQNTEWGDDKLIKLTTLTSDEAIKFLQNKLICNKNTEEIEKLAEELQYLPLALQLAVAYINDRNQQSKSFTLSQYVKEFKKKQLLLQQFPDYVFNLYEKIIYKTISLTVERISCENRNALKILHACCYFNADYINWSHFKYIFTNNKELNSAIPILLKYSLLNKQIYTLWNGDTHTYYNIHRLVQLCYRQYKLTDIADCQYILKQVLQNPKSNYYPLNNYYWKDLLLIKKSDYKWLFGNCQHKDALMFSLGYNACNKIIKKTAGILDDKYYFQGLLGAIEKGVLKTVKYLLRSMTETLSSFECNELLKIATSNIFLDLIKLLHRNDINIRKTEAIYYAIRNKTNVEVIKYLIEIDYDLNKKCSHDGNTALHIAVLEDNLDVVKCLVEMGNEKCNLNIQNKNGETPAFIACRKRNKTIFRYLIVESNCDFLTIKNNSGFTLLHYVVYEGWRTGVNILINNNNFNNNNFANAGFTPLHLAVYGNHVLIAKNIFTKIQQNYSTSTTSSNYKDELELIAKYLVNNYHSSATLCVAIKHDWTNIVEDLLLQNNTNIDINAFTDYNKNLNYSVLHLAVGFRRIAIVEILIKYGCDINLQNTRGETPLHLAVCYGCTESVSLLLDNKCNVNLKNTANETPLHLAVQGEHIEIVDILINGGCDVNIQNAKGETALHLAVKHRNAKSVSLLLKQGCDVNNKSWTKTPLMIAKENNFKEIIDMLVKSNDNVQNTGPDVRKYK